MSKYLSKSYSLTSGCNFQNFRIFAAFVFFLSLLFIAQETVFCDTIVLNDGKKIEGLVLEKADSYIKVDFEGVELKIYNKDIKEIIPRDNKDFIVTDKYAQLEKNSLVMKVLEVSKVKDQVESIPSYINDEYAQHKTRMDAKFFDAGNKIMLESYNSRDLYHYVVEYFENNFNRDYLVELKKFFDSPIYQKISDLEKKVSGSDSVEEMKKFGKDLEVHPPTKERSELIKKLDDTIGTTNLQIETMVTMYQGMASAIDPVVESDRRLEPGELDRFAQEMRTELKSILRNVISVSFLYTYQSLSDEELKQYINFWSSDAGRWFNAMSNQAFMSAMNKASKKAAIEFAKLAKNDNIDKADAPQDNKPQTGKELILIKKGDKWIKK